MIRVKKKHDREMWMSEEYLEELEGYSNGHKVSWYKWLKTLITGKAKESTKPQK